MTENVEKKCLCRIFEHDGRCQHTDPDYYAHLRPPKEAFTPEPLLPHDEVLERDVLSLALRDQHDSSFARLVHDGLRAGDELYGRRFEGRDNLAEAQEECRDASCYIILELERLRGRVDADVWDELRMYSIAGVLASYQLHSAIRQIAAIRESRG